MAKPNVTLLRLTKVRAQQLLRHAAGDSSRVVNTLVYRPDQEWFERISINQVNLCLRDGEVISDPKIDEHKNWTFTVHRVCGGQDVYVTIALANSGNEGHKVYILSIENRS